MSEESRIGTVIEDNLRAAGRYPPGTPTLPPHHPSPPPPFGRKDDTGKSPVVRGFMQYFPNALAAVADVSGFGATKYAWGNWVFVDGGIERYTEALGRHLLAEASESHDPESKLLHAAHAAWNAMARLELMLKEQGK